MTSGHGGRWGGALRAEVAAAWAGGGGGQLLLPLLQLLQGAEGGWLREEELAVGAGPPPGWSRGAGSVGRPAGWGGAFLSMEAGFVYTYSQCADPVIAVRFARGGGEAQGGAALRPGRGGGQAGAWCAGGVPFPPTGGVGGTR